MKKFLVIYHAPAAAMEKWANSTPEESAKGMEYWFQWKDQVGEHLVDFGSPLMPGQNVNAKGSWKGSTTDVTGFSILQAATIDVAKKLVENHPHLHSYEGCAITVHETASM